MQRIEAEFDEFFNSEAVQYADIDGIIQLMDKIRDYHLDKFDAESQKLILNLLFSINSNMSMTLSRQFRILEDENEYEWFQKEDFVPPKEILLKAILRNKQVEVLPPYQQTIKLDDIFYNKYYWSDDRGDRIVRLIQLLSENDKIQLQLEENLTILQQNNIKLDSLSKSDPLTGIYNRRGFYEEADRILGDLRKDGKSMFIMYVDMNNLKII